MFPRPINPTGVFEAIDRDDTEGRHEDNKDAISGLTKKTCGILFAQFLLATVQLISLILLTQHRQGQFICISEEIQSALHEIKALSTMSSAIKKHGSVRLWSVEMAVKL